MTQRDDMGREVGGGSGLGTHVHLWWIHVNVWQNQYSLKIKKKKKKKKAEGQRIEAFELWCWRRLLGVPQKARGSNRSVLNEINSEHCLEGLMLKLKHPIL